MKVSVIVPAFNAERTLEAAVDSLLATGYGDLEILVVDDGSSDSTLAKAQELATQHLDVVRTLTHSGFAHRGVSATRNLGIQASNGELIAFLDADDVVLPNRFQTSVAMLREQPSVEGIYALTRIENRRQQAQGGDGQWNDGSIFGINQPLYGEALFRMLMSGIPWGTCAFLCRRSLFDRIGTFDEGRAMAEDCHLWIRAAAAATILPADPLEVVCLYIRHGKNSYRYSLERRLDLLAAMIDAGSWIERHATVNIHLWREGLVQYLVRLIIAARESREDAVAWRALWCALRAGRWFLLSNPQVIRQCVAMSRCSLVRQTTTSE